MAAAMANLSDEPQRTYHTHIAGFCYKPTWTPGLLSLQLVQNQACHRGFDCTAPENAPEYRCRLQKKALDNYRAEMTKVSRQTGAGVHCVGSNQGAQG